MGCCDKGIEAPSEFHALVYSPLLGAGAPAVAMAAVQYYPATPPADSQ